MKRMLMFKMGLFGMIMARFEAGNVGDEEVLIPAGQGYRKVTRDMYTLLDLFAHAHKNAGNRLSRVTPKVQLLYKAGPFYLLQRRWCTTVRHSGRFGKNHQGIQSSYGFRSRPERSGPRRWPASILIIYTTWRICASRSS